MVADTGGVALAPAPARPLWNGRRSEIVAAVRTCVRGLLEQNEAFAGADPETRRAVAHKMVKVALAGADLAAQDLELSHAIAESSAQRTENGGARAAPIATGQAAGDQMGMQAARAAGGTIQSLKTAIDFPGFVTSLINGVFNAITSSAITQLTALSDLLDNVSASADSFTEQNVRDEDVIAWTVAKFPFIVRQDDGLSVREGADLAAQTRTLAEGLSASESEVSGIDESDLLGSLGPLVKRKMGRDRQQILGTLVQMGLQRIVVDEGRLHASMDMRVDTRSVSEQDKRSRSEFGIEAKASGSFGVGAWGASASVGTNYSQVQSDAQYTKEELDTRAGLRSSVDLAFRTEQIPLDRMADKRARVKLDLNARVPASVSEGSLISSESHVGEVAAPQRPIAAQPTPPAQQPAQGGQQQRTPTPPAQGGQQQRTPAPPAQGGQQQRTPAPPAQGGQQQRTPAPPAQGGQQQRTPTTPTTPTTPATRTTPTTQTTQGGNQQQTTQPANPPPGSSQPAEATV